jgi:peptidoglycan-associated lipoprotein
MKKRYAFLAIGLSVVLSACVGTHIRKGNNYFEHYHYAKAIKHYQKALPKTDDINVKRSLAKSFFETNQIDQAKSLYAQLVDSPASNAFDYFYYGRTLMATGEHTQAIPYFEKYLMEHPNDVVAEMLLASSKSINDRFRDTTLFDLKPIIAQDFENTFSIIQYRDGAVFNADKQVFLNRRKSSWTGNSYLGLYYMEKDEKGNWLTPELLKGDVSGPFHDGPATFSADGNVVYFTRSNYFRKTLKANQENESNLKIFSAELVGGKWKNLKEFPFNSDDYSVGHPSLSADGKTLYFVSDMPGGFGGTDIYRSFLVDGNWSKPENLGSTINTPGNEMFPYIHSDGSLYFSSNAHNSMGGLDVFITYFTGQKWAQPENLNYPINSIGDDFSFSINRDNQTGFVSSSRMGPDEMYKFRKNAPTFELVGFAHKKGEDTPVEGVKVEITDSKTGEIIIQYSGKDGKFNLMLEPEKEYLLLCTKMGCFTRTDNISTKGLKYSERFYADFEVEEIVIGKPIVLENIYYDFDKYHIRPDAAIELDKLVKFLNDNPELEIELGSHTDSRGADNYNMVLSSKRAQSAVLYLISKGIDASRLTWRGYGESVLINHCDEGVRCSEEEHQANRRTEFKVMKIRD